MASNNIVTDACRVHCNQTGRDVEFTTHCVRYYAFENETTRLAIFIHGGCLWEEDDCFNDQQVNALISAHPKIKAVQIRFSQRDGTTAAVDEIIAVCNECSNGQEIDYVVGTSSGAFYVAFLSTRINMKRCILLCPMFDPWRRHEDIAELPYNIQRKTICDKQLRHFSNDYPRMIDLSALAMHYMIQLARDVPTVAIYSMNDTNITGGLREKQIAALMTDISRSNVLSVGMGHELSFRAFPGFTDLFRLDV